MTASAFVFYLDRPVWLVALLLIVPIIWLGWRHMVALGPVRRWGAIVLRCLVMLTLVLLLARLVLARMHETVTVIAVIDRSRSIPTEQAEQGLAYLEDLLPERNPEDVTEVEARHRLAVVEVAESVGISTLGTPDMKIRRRNTTLEGTQSRLADGIQMAMAIAPPDSATRIVLLSDGNQTAGDLREAARLAAGNNIPIDVVPMRYEYEREVVFRRLVAPTRLRAGQTVPLRFVLSSTGPIAGRIALYVNGAPIDLDPDSDGVGAPVILQGGTSVHTVSLPIATRGIHEFTAEFIADNPDEDRVQPNNRATALTYIAGPGHVIVSDTDGETGPGLADVLRGADLDARYVPVDEFTSDLTRLMDTDAVILSNVDASRLTFAQQEMLTQYVTALGGGLVMVGGPQSFGAGGWIGSALAEVLPVDCDPPQKKQMPKAALVLVIDHSGSMAGLKLQMCKSAAIAAVRLLSEKDLVGVVAFDTAPEWIVPMTLATDKAAIAAEIRTLGGGGGTDMHPAMVAAAEALQETDTSIRHVILLTDGQTAGADCRPVAQQMAQQNITVSTVAVGDDADFALLQTIAGLTRGRFYPVLDPTRLPQIFVKEAQVVRRALIYEETFTPQLVYALSDIVRGVSAVPPLDGYVLTGPKGGFSQILFASEQGDPILASCQAGLGRCVAFTSSIDSRWAARWLAWSGYDRFWEQVVRWVGKPAQPTDCEVFVDAQGRDISVIVEAADTQGRSIPLAQIEAQAIGPDMAADPLPLTQTGPGQYQGRFTAQQPGSYVVNLRYRKVGADETIQSVQSPVTVPFAPEFRDLRDNAPLLEEIARLTDGRVIELGTEADLFDPAGLKFPQTLLPLTSWLMGLWIALFLADVAIRRIAFDWVAAQRRVATWWRTRRVKTTGDATLERLKRTRVTVQQRFKKRSGTRFEASESDLRGPSTLPETDVSRPPKPERKPPPTIETPREQETSHIQQLLKAKRGALHRDGRERDEKQT